LRLYAITCGWLTASIGNLIEGEQGHIRVPVPCYLIDHPRGKALFDTGLHIDMQTDPQARLGDSAGEYVVEFKPGEEISMRLEELGVGVDEIDFLIQSHLHFEHSGGNAQIPDATLVIQRREWHAGKDPDPAAGCGYNPDDYDLGHQLLAVDGEHDVFGDGRVVCIPTHGHTPGHQSLRVRLDVGDVFLAGDACSLQRSLDELRLPPRGYDRDRMLATLKKLRRLRDAGARILYGHDPTAWATVPQAPAEVMPG